VIWALIIQAVCFSNLDLFSDLLVMINDIKEELKIISQSDKDKKIKGVEKINSLLLNCSKKAETARMNILRLKNQDSELKEIIFEEIFSYAGDLPILDLAERKKLENLGIVALSQDDFVSARECFERIISQSQNSVQDLKIYYWLAIAYFESKDYEKSLKTYLFFCHKLEKSFVEKSIPYKEYASLMPRALMKVAYSAYQLSRYHLAKRIINKLSVDFPYYHYSKVEQIVKDVVDKKIDEENLRS